MVPIYRAGWQLIKVRAVMISSPIAMALCMWCGFDLAQTHGLREADGGVLAPLSERLAVGGVVALLGIGFAVGMGQYGCHYAAWIAFDPKTKQVHLATVGFFWNNHHVINLADLGGGRSHDDINWEVAAAAIAIGHPVALVHAPWTLVRIVGWRWPLIVDQQGVVLHPHLMQRIFVR
jgi:hypothetical protein